MVGISEDILTSAKEAALKSLLGAAKDYVEGMLQVTTPLAEVTVTQEPPDQGTQPLQGFVVSAQSLLLLLSIYLIGCRLEQTLMRTLTW